MPRPGRKFTTAPSTVAGRNLADAITRVGLGPLATQLGVDRYRLRMLISGERLANVTEVLAIAAAGIATLLDWSRPVGTPEPQTPAQPR